MASISCDFVRDRLFDYLEDECDEALRQKIEEHLNECESCRKEADMRRQLLKMLGDSAYYPKSGLAAAFLGAAALEAPKKKFNMRKFVRYGSVAVAAVIVVTVALSSGVLDLIRGGADAATTETAFDTAGNSKSMDYTAVETYAETTAAMAAYGAEVESYTDEDGADGGQIFYSINATPTANDAEAVEEEATEAPKKSMIFGAAIEEALPIEQQRVKDHSPLFDAVQSFYTAGAFVEIVAIEGLETHFGDGYTLHIIESSDASVDAIQKLLYEVGYELSTRVVDVEKEYIALIIPTA